MCWRTGEKLQKAKVETRQGKEEMQEVRLEEVVPTNLWCLQKGARSKEKRVKEDVNGNIDEKSSY